MKSISQFIEESQINEKALTAFDSPTYFFDGDAGEYYKKLGYKYYNDMNRPTKGELEKAYGNASLSEKVSDLECDIEDKEEEIKDLEDKLENEEFSKVVLKDMLRNVSQILEEAEDITALDQIEDAIKCWDY